MPKPGDTIHIPLPFEQVIGAVLKVKPTADMPRPGAQPVKAKNSLGDRQKQRGGAVAEGVKQRPKTRTRGASGPAFKKR